MSNIIQSSTQVLVGICGLLGLWCMEKVMGLALTERGLPAFFLILAAGIGLLSLNNVWWRLCRYVNRVIIFGVFFVGGFWMWLTFARASKSISDTTLSFIPQFNLIQANVLGALDLAQFYALFIGQFIVLALLGPNRIINIRKSPLISVVLCVIVYFAGTIMYSFWLDYLAVHLLELKGSVMPSTDDWSGRLLIIGMLATSFDTFFTYLRYSKRHYLTHINGWFNIPLAIIVPMSLAFHIGYMTWVLKSAGILQDMLDYHTLKKKHDDAAANKEMFDATQKQEQIERPPTALCGGCSKEFTTRTLRRESNDEGLGLCGRCYEHYNSKKKATETSADSGKKAN